MPSEPGPKSYSPRLIPGARNAIEVCLGVQEGQRVFILTDRRTETVARALADAARGVGAPVKVEILEDHVPRPTRSLPDPLLEEVEKAEVVLYCVWPQAGELPSRAQIVHLIERLGRRYAHMVGITERIMCQGMRADFRKVDAVSRLLLERARRCRSVHVTSRAGTNLVARFRPDYIWRKTSGIVEEVWSNLPGGEIFTTPATVDGVFVVDGPVGDHFAEKYGVLGEKQPMRLYIEGGYLTRVECPNKELEKEFWDYCHTAAGSDRVGEFAIGTNLAVFEPIGNLLQDEKIPGVHIAFGDPYGSQTGADWTCPTHVDVITTSCDIWMDGEMIMDDGIFLANQLGFDYLYVADDPSLNEDYE
ncbi:MAG TPA: aminopeptidase [Candidatus Nitrosotenuis sp.]|nr:aminopeptidase [Candidatus Nitrosotenuis sp.]